MRAREFFFLRVEGGELVRVRGAGFGDEDLVFGEVTGVGVMLAVLLIASLGEEKSGVREM